MQTPFFLAGAPKSGTSTLAHLLNQHPEIHIPPQKELFFFDFNYARGLDWYQQLFLQARPGQRIGDATPWYMSWPGVPERIADCFPQARIIFLLRDPVARAWSHYWHDYSSMVIELDLSPRRYFQRAADTRRVRSCSLYATHLRRWLSFFPPGQILLASTLCLQRQPQRLLDDIASFLGCTEPFPTGICAQSTRRMTGLSPRKSPLKLLALLQQRLTASQFSAVAGMLNRHPRLKALFFRSRSMPLTDADRDWLEPIFQADYQEFVALMGSNVVGSERVLRLG